MKIRLVSYTKKGRDTAQKIAEGLAADGHSCRRFAMQKYCSLGDEALTQSSQEWARVGFSEDDALVYEVSETGESTGIAPEAAEEE